MTQFLDPTTSDAFSVCDNYALTVIDYTPANSSAAIAQEVIPHFAIPPYNIIIHPPVAVSDARTKDVANPVTAGSATVPTTFAGVVAVSKFRALLVVIGPPPRARRPTYVSDVAYISDVAPALALSVAPTLCECG